MAIIYILTNILNGKQYIGQTSRSMDVRLRDHLYESTYRRRNLPLYNAIRKYGIENFHIECLTVSDKLVDLWEKHLIKRWETKAHNGYNVSIGGEGGPTKNPDVVKKINATKKRRGIAQGKNNSQAKPIILIHPDGTEEYFDYILAIEKKYGIDAKALSPVAKGKRNHHKGYKARYA